MRVALVTDSASMLEPALRERFSVRVVPLVVTLDGVAYREGADISTEQFYDRLGLGAEVGTAAPSPGEIAEVYEQAAATADAVLAIHVGSNLSGTVTAARVAARELTLPIEVVDTGTASFALGCCVWAAADAVAEGANLASASRRARSIAERVRTVFITGAAELARRGGRFDPSIELSGPGTPVIATGPGEAFEQPATARDADEAVEAMAEHVAKIADGRPLRVGVGHARALDLADALEARLRQSSDVDELVRYEVGPSVGAHMGAGTVGAVFHVV